MTHALHEYDEDCLSWDYQEAWGIPKPMPSCSKDRGDEVKEIEVTEYFADDFSRTTLASDETDPESEMIAEDEKYQDFLRKGEDASRMSDEEFEQELDRAFLEATKAADVAWEKEPLTPECVGEAVQRHRRRHPYRHG